MDALLLVAAWLLPALFVHAFYAISLTGAQRLAILNAINDSDPQVALDKLNAFTNDSFDAHLWRLLTFRSPWKIYPALLRNEVQRAGA